jgi:uncharacterized protein (TIGR01244 family)
MLYRALVIALSLGIAACATTRSGADTAPQASVAPAAAQPALAATPSGVALNAPKPGVYTAGQPAASDWSALAGAGVRTVVNLRTAAEMNGRDERAEVAAAGMRYIEIPIDGANAINAENARALADALASAQGGVLVHCASANRAGGLLAVALAQQGTGTDEALRIGRAAGMKSTEARVIQLIAAPQPQMCASGASPGDSGQQCPSAPRAASP